MLTRLLLAHLNSPGVFRDLEEGPGDPLDDHRLGSGVENGTTLPPGDLSPEPPLS